ncbi:hypothetical protein CAUPRSCDRAFT_13154 [Caulochytrium protostelioides]|uniref:Uncharacterized protein n=1 Tax=Caulochytrium protostelioides TaxID=1555241 RepID=A0A4P9WRT1_9FUNG|nr:hypothetical protein CAUPRSCDRAFT_13154 [Caulochytrium protostelioides]
MVLEEGEGGADGHVGRDRDLHVERVVAGGEDLGGQEDHGGGARGDTATDNRVSRVVLGARRLGLGRVRTGHVLTAEQVRRDGDNDDGGHVGEHKVARGVGGKQG